jgi:glycerate-2-kinase
VLEALQTGRGETIKPGDPRLAGNQTRMIATPQMALEAAAQVARESGVTPYILGDAIEGEARDVGKVIAGIALQVASRGLFGQQKLRLELLAELPRRYTMTVRISIIRGERHAGRKVG